jgi:hypothetical protein
MEMVCYSGMEGWDRVVMVVMIMSWMEERHDLFIGSMGSFLESAQSHLDGSDGNHRLIPCSLRASG